MEKLSKGITGIAGEYFVAAELSLRGYMASITLRNNDSIDIHASKLEDNDKIFAIQVKTAQVNNRKWILNKKVEDKFSKSMFYIFVGLKGLNQRPDYYIVPSIDLAKMVKKTHHDWLITPGKNGEKHIDSDVRNFKDYNGDYLERWDLLK
ncbi:hypothetical protein [Aquirufa aurantiipilula]